MRLITRCVKGGLAAFAVAALTFAAPASATLLSNAGFESAIAFANVDGNWNGFSGSANAFAANSTVMPRNGVQHLDVTIAGDDNSFAGVFQWYRGVIVGNSYEFSFWAKNSAAGNDSEFRIEWLDGGGGFVGGQFDNNVVITAALTSQYQLFSQNLVAPAGAVDLKVVIASQSFGPDPANVSILYVDDATLTPEPASLGLLAAGALALAGRRRK